MLYAHRPLCLFATVATRHNHVLRVQDALSKAQFCSKESHRDDGE